MTEEEHEQIRQILREEITERRAAAVSIAADFSDLRGELARRMDTIERRFDTLAPIILSLDTRMAAFTRAVDQLITAHGQTGGTLAGQQRAMDDIITRLKALEEKTRRREPPQQ